MNAVAEKPKLLTVMATRLGVEPENMLRILKNTCIKPTRGGKEATNEEVQAFLIVANKYDLNPLTREIFAFESNGSIIPIVSIDGWATLVNRNEHFDGCDFDTEYGADGSMVSITCRIFDKRRNRPIAVTEYLAECQRPTQPWRTMPHRMLRHKAFMQAARLAFGLSGIYDEDEGLQIAKNEMQVIVEENPQPAQKGMAGLRGKLLSKPQAQPEPQPKTVAPENATENSCPEPEAAPEHEPEPAPSQANPGEQKTMLDEPVNDRHRVYDLLVMAKSKKQLLDIGKRLCAESPELTDLIAEVTDQVITEKEEAS